MTTDLRTGVVADEAGGIGWPLVRTQVDGMQDQYSLMTGLNCEGSKDMTRQEWADEADITKLLSRYGVGPQPQRQVTYGEWDESVDLQTAYQAVDDAKHAYAKAPQWMRESYPTWAAFLEGVNSGKLSEQKATWEEHQRRATVEAERKAAMEALWEKSQKEDKPPKE